MANDSNGPMAMSHESRVTSCMQINWCTSTSEQPTVNSEQAVYSMHMQLYLVVPKK